MNQKEWYEGEQETIKLLDSINLINEMEDGREDLKDFMDKLEEKYSFKCHDAISLFDGFGIEDFKDYLYNRYKNKECYINEYIITDIVKR